MNIQFYDCVIVYIIFVYHIYHLYFPLKKKKRLPPKSQVLPIALR